MQENYSVISGSNDIQLIDLFSGCGGFGFGFLNSGFNLISGLDFNESAAKTASINLFWQNGLTEQHFCSDIQNFDLDLIGVKIDKTKPLVVIGGPPCQAYSQIGRAKLRSLGEHRIHTKDKRGMLYNDFINAVLEFDADIAVMENVMESVNYGGQNIPNTVAEIFEENGYSAKWTVLNSADFGVPQIRERVFVIASKDKEVLRDVLPSPTHYPINGMVSSGMKRIKKFKESSHFIEPKDYELAKREWISVSEAISDLPSLHPSGKSEYKYLNVNMKMKYDSEPQNEYQKLMRLYNGEIMSAVSANSYRRTKRDYPIFELMKPGDNYKAASEIADYLLDQYCRFNNIEQSESNTHYIDAKKKIVPPYSREKFLSKWRKLSPNIPSHTLVAHLSVDTYSHIHPWEARGISIREAARIQSFPDYFIFQTTMGDAYKQIGNAVPPLLSEAISNSIKEYFFNSPYGEGESSCYEFISTN